MTKMKSSIKVILSNWYFIKALDTPESVDILLPVEQAIEKLSNSGEFTELDIVIINAYKVGFNLEEMSKLIKISRQTVATHIERIVTRLQVVLGDTYEL